MAKLLGEMFWADRWLASSARYLPLEIRGLYREMLTAAWTQGASLPNDHEAIQRAVACTDDEWSRCWPAVKRYWHVRDDDGRLVNDTQLEIYAKALHLHTTRSDAARERWQRQAKATLATGSKRDAKRDAKPNAKRGGVHGAVHDAPHMHLNLNLNPNPNRNQKLNRATSTTRARERAPKTGKPVEKRKRTPQ